MTAMSMHRAIGAVIGAVVGDALGAPFEFGQPFAYAKRFPTPVIGGIGELIGGGGFGWAPGEFTDDTQMAIIQAESLLANDGLNPEDLFRRFQTWASSANDVGSMTRAILRGTGPEAAVDFVHDNPNNAAGNGGVMRATPTVVWLAARLGCDAARAEAARITAVTHADPAVAEGVDLFTGMMHTALHGGDAFVWLDEALTTASPRYRTMLSPSWAPTDERQLSNGTVWTCLAQAVWAVRHHETFESAVVAAINLGGDTDTVAAVSGGLAGAIHGIQAIPSRWVTYLNGTTGTGPRWNAARLRDFAVELTGSSVPAMARPPEPVGLTEIDAGVSIANLAGAMTVSADTAVISLCRVGESFGNHPIRREVFLVDQTDANPDLTAVVNDTIATIDAFLAEGRHVVVHCHAGESRSVMMVTAWLMHRHGYTHEEAREHLASRWPTGRLWNPSFVDFLESYSPAEPAAAGVELIASVFSGGRQTGDFGWMIKQPEYADALFVFNDNETSFRAFRNDPDSSLGGGVGGGNAVIRPYRCTNPPRAAGIPTGDNGGYAALTPHVRAMIDEAISVIADLLAIGRYRRLIYSGDGHGSLGTGIFDVADDVKAYIVSSLQNLVVKPGG